MINVLRKIEGDVLILRCYICESTFPYFLFSGEIDSSTVGLCSASSCKVNEIIITETSKDEWNDLTVGKVDLIEKRLGEIFDRNDIKIIKLLRSDSEHNVAKGMKFKDFKDIYKLPNLIYSCICCSDGESRAIEKVTVEKFKKDGGSIITLGNIVF